MTYPFIEYIATAGQRDFDVTFPFLSRTHVEVLVNGVLTGIVDWVTPSRLRINPPATAGAVVQIQRNTPIDGPLVEFQNGAVLTREDLNTAVLQVLYRQQELQALYDNSLKKAVIRLGDNLGIVTDPEAVIDELAQLTLQSAVFGDLQSRIADIQANSLGLLEAGNAISGVNGRLALLGVPDGNGAWLLDTTKVKVSPTETLASRLNTTASRLGNSEAAITSIQNTLATFNGGTVADLTVLFARVGAVEAAVEDETEARVTADTAQTTARQALESRVTTAEGTLSTTVAGLATEASTRASADSALSTLITNLTARTDNLDAALVSESAARASGDAAEATQRALLQVQILRDKRQMPYRDTFNYASWAEASAAGWAGGNWSHPADWPPAMTTYGGRRVLRVRSASELYWFGPPMEFTEGTTYAVAVTVETPPGQDPALVFGGFVPLDRLGATISPVDSGTYAYPAISSVPAGTKRRVVGYIRGTAAVGTGQNVGTPSSDPADPRPAPTGTHAMRPLVFVYPSGSNQVEAYISELTIYPVSEASDLKAAIITEQNARVTADTAFANQLSLLTARVGSAESAIFTESQVRAGQDTALAGQITNLQTSINGNTASITQLLESVNGLNARYGVSLDVNGFVTGFIQNNAGAGSSSFTIVANRFALVDPGNGVTTPVVPFEVSGGVTRIRDALIGNLQVNKLTSGTLTATIGLNGDINVGTGRIIWDNGAFMKVAGVGFGSANQFIEWFGPKMAISACSEANAISYLKTNGDAYFGGSLTAGLLRNAVQSTIIGPSAEALMGPFGSNGDPRTVVLSFNYFHNRIISNAVAFTGTASVQAVLERSFDGVNWVQLTTLNVGGNVTGVDGIPGETGFFRVTINGSTTFTDNSGGLSVRYRARIITLTLPNLTSSVVTTDAHTQSLGIVSTEQ